MGTVISKVCVADGIAYQGHLMTYNPQFGLYRVQYEDGDQEEFDEEEVAQYRIRGADVDEDKEKEDEEEDERDDSDDDDEEDTSSGVTGTAVASTSVAATADQKDDDAWEEKTSAAKHVCTTDRRTMEDTEDDKKKSAAQHEYTTDREIASPSVLSPLASLKQDEQILGRIFAFHDYNLEFDVMKRTDCISDELMRTLIAHEADDDACAHGHTSDQYHISRAMEVLLFLAKETYTGPPH